MDQDVGKSFGAIGVAIAVAAAVAWAGSFDGVETGGLPVFAWAGIVAFLVQWIVFVPSYFARTEHYFDITGSFTYLLLVWGALWLSDADPRAWLLVLCVTAWAVRLGGFLFMRVRKQGGDDRFDDIKASWAKFLMAWTLQGLWVYLTLAAALAAVTARGHVGLGWIAGVGFVVWLVGFLFEAVADAQKWRFKQDPANQGQFIDQGLWSWSRHPNYFGEITLWVGVAIMAAPALEGWQWVTLVSPVFVFVLLRYVSGVPMLEAKAKKKWGDQPEFRAYRERTPLLFPRPPTRS